MRIDPFRFVPIALAGWMDKSPPASRNLRKPPGERRWRLSDDQRQRLAAKARAEVATIVTTETCCAGAGDRSLNNTMGAAIAVLAAFARMWRSEIGGSEDRQRTGAGISPISGRLIQSRTQACSQYESENDVQRISDATREIDCRRRLLHHRGLYNCLIEPERNHLGNTGEVQRRER